MQRAVLNLVIFHKPGWQRVSDFTTIKALMRERAPEIRVHIVTPTSLLPPGFWPSCAEHPTALFASTFMKVDPQVRGARLIPKVYTKFEEITALRDAGLPVPDSVLLTPGTAIDEHDWGPFVVIKPNRGRQGDGVRLVNAKDARWRDTAALPDGHLWKGRELVVQRFVDTGPLPACYRVMTVFGRKVYCVLSASTVETPALDAATIPEEGIPIAANGKHRVRSLAYDDDVLSLAEDVHGKLTHTPVMGIDIIRERETGKLYVLELNSGGLTWHISSDYGLRQQAEDGADKMAQFNALEVIADAFIDATRKHAI
ncbi:MAG: RimK family alpha-L-glutamate ligase [Parvibaculaceae bacterium]